MMATTSPQTCIETPANIVSARAVPTPEVSAEQPEKPRVTLPARGRSVPRVPFTIWVRDQLVPRLRPGDIDSTISGRTCKLAHSWLRGQSVVRVALVHGSRSLGEPRTDHPHLKVPCLGGAVVFSVSRWTNMARRWAICRGARGGRNGDRSAGWSTRGCAWCQSRRDRKQAKQRMCWRSARTRPRNRYFALRWRQVSHRRCICLDSRAALRDVVVLPRRP